MSVDEELSNKRRSGSEMMTVERRLCGPGLLAALRSCCSWTLPLQSVLSAFLIYAALFHMQHLLEVWPSCSFPSSVLFLKAACLQSNSCRHVKHYRKRHQMGRSTEWLLECSAFGNLRSNTLILLHMEQRRVGCEDWIYDMLFSEIQVLHFSVIYNNFRAQRWSMTAALSITVSAVWLQN